VLYRDADSVLADGAAEHPLGKPQQPGISGTVGGTDGEEQVVPAQRSQSGDAGHGVAVLGRVGTHVAGVPHAQVAQPTRDGNGCGSLGCASGEALMVGEHVGEEARRGGGKPVDVIEVLTVAVAAVATHRRADPGVGTSVGGTDAENGVEQCGLQLPWPAWGRSGRCVGEGSVSRLGEAGRLGATHGPVLSRRARGECAATGGGPSGLVHSRSLRVGRACGEPDGATAARP
jgi:hypothetical protein